MKKQKSIFRAIRIWMRTGILPTRKTDIVQKRHSSAFVRGAAEQTLSILQDDAIRTTVHLLLRPGYMIRDCLNGSSRFLSPLTALLIFYSFLTLAIGIAQVDIYQEGRTPLEQVIRERLEQLNLNEQEEDIRAGRAVLFGGHVYDYLHLDEYPELIDAPWKGSLAAVEANLRGQGVTRFLGLLLVLSMAIWLALHREAYSFGQAATIAAFILSQNAIWRTIFTLIMWGMHPHFSLWWLFVFIFFDLWQLLDGGWRKALGRTALVLLYFVLIIVLLLLLLLVIMFYVTI